MTDKIIAIDCSLPVMNVINDIFGNDVLLETESFKNIRELKDYRMIIVQEGIEKPELLKQIRKLRYACHFKNVPIVVIKIKDDKGSMESFITAVRIDPYDAQSHYNLGLFYFLIKKKGPAFEQYKILKVLNQNYATRLLMYVDSLR